MIWSRRALKRSFCPLSRRSLGRIESPSAKPTERQNHDQTSGSICKKSNQQPPLSCKCSDLPFRGNASKIRPFRILHGRLYFLICQDEVRQQRRASPATTQKPRSR